MKGVLLLFSLMSPHHGGGCFLLSFLLVATSLDNIEYQQILCVATLQILDLMKGLMDTCPSSEHCNLLICEI